MPFSRPAFSGFPFDRTDRDDNFRHQLDDIAKRHPELAEHLEGFPFRTNSNVFAQNRPPRPETRRPFGSSRFDHFFEDDDDDPFEQQAEPEQPPPKQSEEQPKKSERGRKPNIQPSNTVDLGQKQEPVNDNRNQRSMSAPPPDNRQQRYVSSIHIPINRDGRMGEMGKTQSQQQQQPQEKSSGGGNKPLERVIPIHVEGRDEPVIPKNVNIGGDKIFGQSPSQFTQFVPKEASPPPPPTQESTEPPAPPTVSKPNTPIDLIQSIQKDVSELMTQVEKFGGAPRDKQYLYLDEMLTRNLLKLDNIDTQGQENIRQARREAVKCIESCISILEAKAAANVLNKKTEESGNETIEDVKENVEKPEPEEKVEEEKVEMKHEENQ